HRALCDRRATLVTQTGTHPMRGVTLLAGRRGVLTQPPPDQLVIRAQRRRLTDRHLAFRWHRRRQRLPHRASMHVMAGGKSTNAQPFQPAIPANTFIKLHPRHLLPPRSMASSTTERRSWWVGGGDNSDHRTGTKWGQ